MTDPLPVRTILTYGLCAGGIAIVASVIGNLTTPEGSHESSLNVLLTLVILSALIGGPYLAATRQPEKGLTVGGLTALVAALSGAVISAATGALFRDNGLVSATSRTFAFTSIGLIAGYVAFRRSLTHPSESPDDDDSAANAPSNGRDHDQ